MFESTKYINTFTDMMEEGFIVIDNEGKIQIYNKKAKEIFRIDPRHDIQHDRGRISKGDIVIIGNNAIGMDDGSLSHEDLEYLGIRDEKIKRGDAFVAVGVYKEKSIKPVYKFLDKEDKKNRLDLKVKYMSLDVGVDIDFKQRVINIKVDGESYPMEYTNAIGHLVILDGKTLEVKFYQHSGYTARGESLRDILHGKQYRAKGKGSESLRVIGKDIFEIHESEYIIQRFLDVAKGKKSDVFNRAEDINGISTLCSILGVKDDDGRVVGAALKVTDISVIEKTMTERDRAIEELKRAEERLYQRESLNKAFSSFVGNSKEISYVKRMALRAANTNSNVLILGESGTGKTILAKAIHDNSRVKDKPFIQVNCGSIPESLLESELFGYEKGAFTGARADGKKGFFEMAHGGTIFLDEIADISSKLQVKLLQVIQSKTFYRVGGTEEKKVDVRIITATNKNLEKEMLEERFREDLYYRINVFPIYIPSLRERKEDIPELVDLLLPRVCEELDSSPKSISREAMEILLEYDWPGNVRELENILERAVNLAEGYTVLSKHVRIENLAKKTQEENFKNLEIKSLRESMGEKEKEIIEEALDFHDGDRRKTIEALDISRSSFYQKLKEYGIS